MPWEQERENYHQEPLVELRKRRSAAGPWRNELRVALGRLQQTRSPRRTTAALVYLNLRNTLVFMLQAVILHSLFPFVKYQNLHSEK